VACLALVLVLDRFRERTRSSYLVLGLVDESAHLLTSVVGVLAVVAVRDGSVRRSWIAAAVIAGNLIDIDHVPQVLGSRILTERTPRPYSHSLTLLALLLALRSCLRGRASSALLGAAFGVGGHLLRDLGTASVALFWPVSYRAVRLPYAAYVAVLVTTAAVPMLRAGVSRWRPRRRGEH
jgi:hypothetical protein